MWIILLSWYCSSWGRVGTYWTLSVEWHAHHCRCLNLVQTICNCNVVTLKFAKLKNWIWRAFEICCKDWQIAGNERETPEPEFKCKQLVRANLIQIAPLLNLDSNIGSSICHWIIAILELFKVVYYGLYLIPLLKLNLSFKWKQIALELGNSRQHKGICPGRT